jgi:hypothetical protein
MVQKESSNRRHWWKVHPPFDKFHLTFEQDDECEEAQPKKRRRSTPVRRIIRRRPTA